MPEPRETHTAIDARRNAERGGGERDALAALIKDAYYHARDNGGTMHTAADDAADAILAAGWLPERVAMEGAVAAGEAVRVECNRRIDALAATVQRVRELCDDNDVPPNDLDIHVPGFVPVSDLRRALGATPPRDTVAAVLERVRAALDEGDIQRQTGVQVGMRVLAALDAVDQYLYGDGDAAASDPATDTGGEGQ